MAFGFPVDDIYDSAFPWYTFGQRGVGRSLEYKYLTNRRFDTISAKHFLSVNDGDYIDQLRVIDPDAGLEAQLNIDLSWSKASE